MSSKCIQTLRILDSSQDYVNVTEPTLGNVQNQLIEPRGLGVESAGNVSSEEELAGRASQVNATIERLSVATPASAWKVYLVLSVRYTANIH